MSNPDLENDAPEHAGGSDTARRVNEIELRDFDRIRERTPFQLKPVHVKVGAAVALATIVLAVVAGWMLGRSADTGRPAIQEITGIRSSHRLKRLPKAIVRRSTSRQNRPARSDAGFKAACFPARGRTSAVRDG